MRFEEEAKKIINEYEVWRQNFKPTFRFKESLDEEKKIIEKIAKIISDIIDDECWDCEFYLRDNKIHEPKIHEPMWDSSELD